MGAGDDESAAGGKKAKKAKKKRKKRITKVGIDVSHRKKDAKAQPKAKAKTKTKAKAKTKTAKAPKKKAASKKKAGRKRKGSLPPRAMVLTDANGEMAGVLPRHALVLVRRGIVVGPTGQPAGVDPRPTQKAFMWLTGSRYGQGLNPEEAHQRLALRMVELLVRASVVSQPADIDVIEELWEALHNTTGRPPPSAEHEAPPLSTSDWGLPVSDDDDSG